MGLPPAERGGAAVPQSEVLEPGSDVIGPKHIEGQPWITLPGLTCRWNRAACAWSTPPAGSCARPKVASEPAALITFLRGLNLPLARIGLEAGPLSQWLQAALVKAGFEAVLLETRHVKAALSAMIVKTDRKDARGIAQLLRMGWFRPVHCKSAPRACKPVGGWLPIEVGFGLTERGRAGAEAGMACEVGGGAGAGRDHGDRGRVSRAQRGGWPGRPRAAARRGEAAHSGAPGRDGLGT